MNNKGQGFLEGVILAFIVGIVVLLLSIVFVPMFNAIFDSQIPLMNSMTNFSTFAAIMAFIPVLIVIFGIIYIVRLFSGQRQQ